MLKNVRLVILFHMFLNPTFKTMTSFVNIARTTASISEFTMKGFKSSRIGSLYEK